jgi:hypothetical protein
MLDVTQTATLLGGSLNQPSSSVSKLITGESGDVTLSALTPYSNTSSLKRQQVTALQNLKDYVDQNIDDDQTAAELQRQIAATEALMNLGMKEAGARVDPVYSLLSANASSFTGLDQGSLVNQLV